MNKTTIYRQPMQESIFEEEFTLEALSVENQKEMRKIAKSSGGFCLFGWTAKLGIGSWVFFYIYFCLTMFWFWPR